MNLIEQFSKFANCYFLMICVMQTIPLISVTNNHPTTLAPLAFVLLLSMTKDLYEDMKRSKSDKQENTRKVEVHTGEDFKLVSWLDVHVGQIVRVKEGGYFPADLLLLHSAHSNGLCFVETKNLDGETNLKRKQIVSQRLLNQN